MSNKLAASLICLALSLTAQHAVAEGNAEAGKTKSATCAACHGADGNSVAPTWPKLAGQHADYLAKQLKDFKEGQTRSNAQMAPMVAGLSDQDMDDLAAYFAAQTQTPGVAKEENLELGENIYRGGVTESGIAACIGCHGPAGKGQFGANYPQIAGQHADYTVSTLKEFRAGTRSNDPGSAMRNVAKRMTDAEITAVANYIQGLR